MRAGHAGSPWVILAVATPRLYSPAAEDDPRGYFAGLVTELGPPASEPTLREEVRRAPEVLVFDAVLRSRFRPHREACARQGVRIIDGAVLAALAIRSPLRLLARAARMLGSAEVRGLLREGARARADFIAALVIDTAYEALLPPALRSKAYFLTSNSYSTEILRLHLHVHPGCEQVVELQHGVPPQWEESYYGGVVRLAAEVGGAAKHWYTPQVGGLPHPGVFARRWFSDNRGVNTFLNRYLLDRQREAPLGAVIAREWCTLFPQHQGETDLLVVSVTGTTAWVGDPFRADLKDGNFEVERFLMRTIREALAASGRPFAIIYTPHPHLDLATVRSHPFFAAEGIIVYPSTVFTWFVADACLSLYSSTLFEARYFGARAFTPVVSADDVYAPETLALLEHPAAGESLGDAVRAFARTIRERPPVDVVARAHQRLATLAPAGLASLHPGPQ